MLKFPPPEMTKGLLTVTEEEVAEEVPVPMTFTALIATVYPAPFVRPVMVNGEVVTMVDGVTQVPELSEY